MAIVATSRDGFTVVTPPAAEPISLAEARKQVELHVSETAHDDHLARLITSARERVERMLSLQLVTCVSDWTVGALPARELLIPVGPLQSIDSITYIDQAGDSVVWASENYIVRSDRTPARVTLAYGKSWPITRNQANAITLRLTTGHGDETQTPELLKAAMLLMIGAWFYSRESEELPEAALDLIHPYDFGGDFYEYQQ